MMDWDLVRGVSRSFFLSLRLLPRPMREPTALAYLLARATDSIADASGLPLAQRRSVFPAVREGVLQRGSLPSLEEVLEHGALPATERDLLRALPALTRQLSECADRDLMVELLATITEGQWFDLERFHAATAGPLTDEELEIYTYQVAGSVGIFWTRLAERKWPGFSSLPRERMEQLGMDYGKGLQLVNLLRDLATDLEAGRGYLDASRLGHLFERARKRLEAGFTYSAAVRNGRLRYATLLPAAIALPTLSKIESVGAEYPVKIPRTQVRRIMGRCLPVLLFAGAVDSLRRNLDP